MKSFILAALVASASAAPLIHPETGLAITTTGQHWYGQQPLALAQAPLIHPETGLAITTTGQHWYGQQPLALAQAPLIHPETGLPITTTGQHWYGQEPLALAQTSKRSHAEEAAGVESHRGEPNPNRHQRS